MNIDERFEKLEKQIKTLKKMLGGVAALAALVGGTVLGVHAANGSFDTLTAKTIYVKDSSGRTRVQLVGSTGYFALYDSSGPARVVLRSDGYFKAMHTHGYSLKTHLHTAHKPQAHPHSASSKSSRKGSNRHSHTITVNK